jgi:flagellar hook assembly protein FlgD
VLQHGAGLRHIPVPSESALFQNHPNPFNPSTTIGYDVPEGVGHVTLQVYDIKGTLVRTLVNTVPPGGRHTVEWDGRDGGGHAVSTGIYFYQLKAGGFVDTRKMLLMK